MLTYIVRTAALAASAAFCVLCAFAYVLRPDSLAGLTFWPVWAWAMAGIFLAILAWIRKGRGRGAAKTIIFLWALCLVALAEEPSSLYRLGGWPSEAWMTARGEGKAIRVISINCAIGNPKAATEVIPYHPDIVLLQESPSEKEVRALADKLYGKQAGVAYGHDTAIIARGDVTQVFPLKSGRDLKSLSTRFYTQARVRTLSGFEMDAISVHLKPPVLRFDPWSRHYWRDYTDRRRFQRGQMQLLTRAMSDVPASVPLISGGDYNAPGGDGIFRLLRPRLRDAFKEGGRGWGNTVINEFPVSRIDQIWVSRHFAVSCLIVRRTDNSDHRMVICDLLANSHKR